MTNRDETHVLKAVKQDSHISISEIREKVLPSLGKIVSLNTVRRVLYTIDLIKTSEEKNGAHTKLFPNRMISGNASFLLMNQNLAFLIHLTKKVSGK